MQIFSPGFNCSQQTHKLRPCHDAMIGDIAKTFRFIAMRLLHAPNTRLHSDWVNSAEVVSSPLKRLGGDDAGRQLEEMMVRFGMSHSQIGA
ncbi:hypothetical protein BgiMline_011459 [Biomphalaria glabrata]|nr:hypothetical protein BgiMline_028940 [Biomphalaria glabrata]